jgi:EmrB/QacA subfamily drug resistance transporter
MQLSGVPAVRGRLTLLICCSALFMTTLDNTILNVALPSLQHDLSATVSGLQWTVDGYILVRGALLFASGSLGDRYGRRRLFRVGLVVFTAASLACSLAPALGALVAFRGAQAVGGALMTPSTLAIIANTFRDPRQRAQAIGIWSATTGLSTAAGPVLGGLLVSYVGWRSVFWVNVPIGVAALLATRWLGESRADRARPLDLPGQGLLAVALGGLIYALIEAPHAGWGTPGVLLPLLVAAGCGAGFVVVELRRRHPMLPLGYFRSPVLVGAVVMAVVAFIALGGFTFFNTLYLQDVRGFSPVEAGLLMLPTTLVTLVFSPLSGWITGNRGARLPATVACGLIAAAMAALALVVTPATAIVTLTGVYLLLGVGMGLANAPITNAAVSSMPPSQAGVAGATTSTARQIGTSLGVAMLGSVIFSVAGPAASRLGEGAGPHGGVAATAAARAAGEAFTAGLRQGYWVAAALAAGCLVLALVAFRRRQAAQVIPAGSATPAEPAA